jgi:type II secretory pathway component GspD/PulD (secretin)
METKTNMIVQDGQTIMLGGILFQEASTVRRKLPLIGDTPLVGSLFRHKEAVAANSEMLIFITPYVIDEPDKMLPETIEEIERPKKKLEEIKEQLEAIPRGWKQKTSEIDEPDKMTSGTKEEMEHPKKKLEEIKEQLETTSWGWKQKNED